MREQSFVPHVRMADDLADSAAGILEQAFPDGTLKSLGCVPGVSPTSVSRARAGERRTNPLYRLALWIYAARRAGMPRFVAQLLVDWLQDVVDRLWSVEDLPTVAEASTREQRFEAEETAAQVAYANGDRAVRTVWLEHLRLERAATSELIAALEAEERAERLRPAA